MKHVMTAALVAGLFTVGAAYAQTPTSQPAGTTMGSPGTAMQTPGTMAPALGSNSQTMAPRTNATSPAAITTTTAPARTTAAPVAGANSFTEAEARKRIEDKGFANVMGLKKDDKGVWRGTAMKSGQSTAVAMDYQGNVVGQ